MLYYWMTEQVCDNNCFNKSLVELQNVQIASVEYKMLVFDNMFNFLQAPFAVA